MSEPTNIVNMKLQDRLIREAREARAKRKAERNNLWNSPQEAALTVVYPGGIDDMEI